VARLACERWHRVGRDGRVTDEENGSNYDERRR
jgi:hypothetical protein